jgi:hypothetical protein
VARAVGRSAPRRVAAGVLIARFILSGPTGAELAQIQNLIVELPWSRYRIFAVFSPMSVQYKSETNDALPGKRHQKRHLDFCTSCRLSRVPRILWRSAFSDWNYPRIAARSRTLTSASWKIRLDHAHRRDAQRADRASRADYLAWLGEQPPSRSGVLPRRRFVQPLRLDRGWTRVGARSPSPVSRAAQIVIGICFGW